MKKMILAAALAVAAVGSLKAQHHPEGQGPKHPQSCLPLTPSCCKGQSGLKASKGKVTTEFALSLKGSNPLLQLQDGSQVSGFGTGALRARYFLQDQLALRGGLGLGVTSEEVNSQKVSSTLFDLGLGIEKHFSGTRRLSPYVGADLKLSLLKADTNGGGLHTGQRDGHAVGLNLLLGADYYVLPKIYVGAEAGLGLHVGSIEARGQKTSFTNVATGMLGGLRIGFVF